MAIKVDLFPSADFDAKQRKDFYLQKLGQLDRLEQCDGWALFKAWAEMEQKAALADMESADRGDKAMKASASFVAYKKMLVFIEMHSMAYRREVDNME